MKNIFTSAMLILLSTTGSFGQVCTDTNALGSASNIYTIGLTESNAIAVNNDLNTIVFVHRNDASIFGGHSGNLRYDISTDNGVNWTSNLGPLNPASVNGTNAARYPNIALYNPPSNTDPNNAYLSYYAPTVATTWDSHVSGVRKLDGTGNTENYNQASITQTLIPRSMCKGAPGNYWAIDAVFNGSQITGYRILKGVWNGTNDIVWSVNATFSPAFNLNSTGSSFTGDFAIGFDPSGQIGWAVMLTDISTVTTGFSFDPVFYKTVNGGTTWSAPEQVDLSQFGCISSIITAGNSATAAFDVDITVDSLGTPHALMCVGSGPGTYSIFFTQAHHMYDITREQGFWNAVDLGNVPGGRNTFGTAPNQLSMDMEPQASRTDDGTKVFFSWSGSDITPVSEAPNLFGAGYDVVTKKWTQMKDFSTCNPATSGSILFPKMAENVLELPGGWELPIVYAELTVANDLLSPTNFVYLDSLMFTQADFVTPLCVAPVTFTNPDTVTLCPGGSVVLSLSGTYNKVLWSNGMGTNGIFVSNPGWYYVTVRSNCCIGRDSLFVMVDVLTTSAFSSNPTDLSVGFTDMSTGSPSTWLWDFGDGSTSNLQNPTHLYSAAGTYTICLMTSDGCAPDTICNTITVTCTSPPPNFSFFIGAGGNGLNVDFSDLSNGSPFSWLWDFGDGTSSTLQNPSHVYSISGSYTACLTTQDPCGTDSVCFTVIVDVTALDELMELNIHVYPNPTEDKLHVEATGLNGQDWTLNLLNTLGEVFWTRSGIGEKIEETLITEHLAPGVYFLQIQSASSSSQYKVVKE